MSNIRVEYTKESEEVIIDRDVSNNDEIQKVFDDINPIDRLHQRLTSKL